MQLFRKPKALSVGSRIAIISASWGGSTVFPKVYQAGIHTLDHLGFELVEYPSTRLSAEEIASNPKLRADEINQAFADDNIDGVITTIGGEDSIRVLPHLNTELIQQNPKFFMGYSDTTSLNTYLNQLGLVTFNGPAVMSGFAQLNRFDETYQSYLRDALFNRINKQVLPIFSHFSEGYPDWSNSQTPDAINTQQPSTPPTFIQGQGKHIGQLFGGCMEVLEMLKGTAYWPQPDFWQNKILFLETSEGAPPVHMLRYWLRNYAMQGIFEQIKGILVGRAYGYSSSDKQALNQTILTIVRDEFGCEHLPVVTELPFGHTDPQLILPLGTLFEIDCDSQTITQLESAFSSF